MRAAATLLAASGSIDGLADVLSAAGFGGEQHDVDDSARDMLGLTGAAARLAGTGSTRTLLLGLASDEPVRDAVHRIARRLSARAPHVLWLVGAVQHDGARAALAAWSIADGQPRIGCFQWEPGRVVDSDAETLCALASVRHGDDVLAHARAFELLGRDALTRRFYRTLERHVTAVAAALPLRARDDARHVALLYVSRLLFLKFLEAKGWLNGERDFIAARFDDAMRAGGRFHRRVLLPLFFGTLNTPATRRARTARAFGRIPFLNGGLFARTAAERRLGDVAIPDEMLGQLLAEVFGRFRFVAREDSATWSEASVDPEMLGRAFESLMAAPERRTSGAYYTPHELVARVADRAIEAALPRPTLAHARDLRVLDPACGSGAFLVYVLERLARMRAELGDTGSIASTRRDVLARSVFGVDRNPTAVWLCEMRLWLSVVIESDETEPARVPPLPNLDRNIRVGDALTGPGFARGLLIEPGGARLSQLRARYIRATGTRKRMLARVLDREERRRLIERLDREVERVRFARGELLSLRRAKNLFGERTPVSVEARRELKQLRERHRSLTAERRRACDGGALPFSFGAFFADVEARGGFDVVVGNPPWVRLHHIPVALRQQLKRSYRVFRSAPWLPGAVSAHVAPGFASQVDLAALFVERSIALLRERGAIALLLPVKLWRALAGGGVRQLLLDATTLLRIEDLSESPQVFEATTYPSLVVARVGSFPGPVTMVTDTRRGRREWSVEPARLSFDSSSGAPWLVMTPAARAAFERVRAAGIPLASSGLGAPRLGVKSGCNAAFIVGLVDSARGIATVEDADGERGTVEQSLLRPALRGDSVTAWTQPRCREWIVWTHGDDGAPLARLPDRANRWLRRRYTDLTARTDAARSRRWWSLFRVDAAESRMHRVVWADFGRRPRALVLTAGDPTVPLNTTYVLSCREEADAWALASVLNSPLAAAWLNAIAEPARGGYRRYLAWTIGLLPLPRDWARARVRLADARGLADDELQDVVLAAFGLAPSDVNALLHTTTDDPGHRD